MPYQNSDLYKFLTNLCYLQDSCLGQFGTIVIISISSNLTLPNDARAYKRPGPGPTQGIMSSGSTHLLTPIGPKQTNMADS